MAKVSPQIVKRPYCFMCGTANDPVTGYCTNPDCPRYRPPTPTEGTTEAPPEGAN